MKFVSGQNFQLYSIYINSTEVYTPFFCLHAHTTDTLAGLTSSLDSILNTTTPIQLSECSPMPAQETDANIDSYSSTSQWSVSTKDYS